MCKFEHFRTCLSDGAAARDGAPSAVGTRTPDAVAAASTAQAGGDAAASAAVAGLQTATAGAQQRWTPRATVLMRRRRHSDHTHRAAEKGHARRSRREGRRRLRQRRPVRDRGRDSGRGAGWRRASHLSRRHGGHRHVRQLCTLRPWRRWRGSGGPASATAAAAQRPAGAARTASVKTVPRHSSASASSPQPPAAAPSASASCRRHSPSLLHPRPATRTANAVARPTKGGTSPP